MSTFRNHATRMSDFLTSNSLVFATESNTDIVNITAQELVVEPRDDQDISFVDPSLQLHDGEDMGLQAALDDAALEEDIRQTEQLIEDNDSQILQLNELSNSIRAGCYDASITSSDIAKLNTGAEAYIVNTPFHKTTLVQALEAVDKRQALLAGAGILAIGALIYKIVQWVLGRNNKSKESSAKGDKASAAADELSKSYEYDPNFNIPVEQLQKLFADVDRKPERYLQGISHDKNVKAGAFSSAYIEELVVTIHNPLLATMVTDRFKAIGRLKEIQKEVNNLPIFIGLAEKLIAADKELMEKHIVDRTFLSDNSDIIARFDASKNKIATIKAQIGQPRALTGFKREHFQTIEDAFKENDVKVSDEIINKVRHVSEVAKSMRAEQHSRNTLPSNLSTVAKLYQDTLRGIFMHLKDVVMLASESAKAYEYVSTAHLHYQKAMAYAFDPKHKSNSGDEN